MKSENLVQDIMIIMSHGMRFAFKMFRLELEDSAAKKSPKSRVESLTGGATKLLQKTRFF